MKTPIDNITPAGVRTPGAARYLGVSQATIKKLVREGKISSVLINRARVFPIAALDELLAGGQEKKAA
jgi:excisionase family DNA binding protein